MPPLLEATSGSWFRKLLASKDQNYTAAFVTERHSVGETIPPHAPPHIHAQGFINPRSRVVERLVLNSLQHLPQLQFRPFTRHFGDETNDSWHIRSPVDRPASDSRRYCQTLSHSLTRHHLLPLLRFPNPRHVLILPAKAPRLGRCNFDP